MYQSLYQKDERNIVGRSLVMFDWDVRSTVLTTKPQKCPSGMIIIPRGSSKNHVVKFLGISSPSHIPPSWSSWLLLQNKAYVIKWLTPPPLPQLSTRFMYDPCPLARLCQTKQQFSPVWLYAKERVLLSGFWTNCCPRTEIQTIISYFQNFNSFIPTFLKPIHFLHGIFNIFTNMKSTRFYF